MDAVLAAFPEGYADLASVSFEYTNGRFGAQSVTILVPEVKVGSLGEAELARRACEAKKALGWGCACEQVEVGAATDYAWSAWPGKRVAPLTLHFFLAC